MKTIDFLDKSEDYHRIEKAIQFLEKNHTSRPTLDQIAQSVHMSKFHFDRMFKRWAGISPIQFLQFLTLDYAKTQLSESKNLFDVSLDAGLSGPGRLHDLFVTFEATTPGEFKNKGRGLKIEYGFCDTPFGECLLAKTERGICHLGFTDRNNRFDARNELIQFWPESEFVENKSSIYPIVNRIFRLESRNEDRTFHLDLKGTNFQVNVWKALLSIPKGSIVSYQNIADYLGKPKAVRAVANSIAKNPVSYLIPCHRVITKSGKIHKYRWGSSRKKAILGWEASRNR